MGTIETVVSCLRGGCILTVFTAVSFSLFSFSGLALEALNCRHVEDLRIVGVLWQLEPCPPHGIGAFNGGFHAFLYQMIVLRSGETERRELSSP